MADDRVDVMPNATKTYANFLALLKYSVPPILLITFFIIWLIA